MSIAIRAALPTDVTTVARLAAATFVEAFGPLYRPADLAAFLSSSRSEAAYEKPLRDPGVGIFLASVGREDPVGYCVAGPCKLPVPGLEPRAGEIRELYVLAEFRKHRLGTQLLTHALGWLDTQGFAPLYVGVWSQNFGAQRLYERFGFAKVGEQVDREFILRR